MQRIIKLINDAFAAFAGLILLFCAFSIGYSIAVRPLGLPSPLWVLQFNEYALIWIAFLATAWLLARDGHVKVQILVSRLSPQARRVVDILHALMGMAACGVFCVYGIETTWDHWVRGVIDVQAVDIPKAPVMMIIPLGFGLLTLQWGLKLWLACTNPAPEASIPESNQRP